MSGFILTVNTTVLPSLSDTVSLPSSPVYSEPGSQPSSESLILCLQSPTMRSLCNISESFFLLFLSLTFKEIVVYNYMYVKSMWRHPCSTLHTLPCIPQTQTKIRKESHSRQENKFRNKKTPHWPECVCAWLSCQQWQSRGPPPVSSAQECSLHSSPSETHSRSVHFCSSLPPVHNALSPANP